MNMQEAIRAVTQKRDLSPEEMTEVMRLIMTGEATQAQIGGFLVGLRMKGETVEEIAAAASVMRELSARVAVTAKHLVDTCGTGGDGNRTFNISTASAIVAAAAGASVAKHGNRSVTSSSGSADVLEAAGIKLDLNPDQVAKCIETCGVGFMFAPMHHSAMKHAVGPRKEMAIRTIFNVLGPLTNPAGAPNQVMGVFSGELIEPLAQVLKRLGSKHVLVVHSADGLDEVSIASETYIAELKDGEVTRYTIEPDDFGLSRTPLDSIKVGSVDESLKMIRSVFANQTGAAKDIVSLNAGAAIYASGLAASLPDGVKKAQQVIANGSAKRKFEQLISTSSSV